MIKEDKIEIVKQDAVAVVISNAGLPKQLKMTDKKLNGKISNFLKECSKMDEYYKQIVIPNPEKFAAKHLMIVVWNTKKEYDAQKIREMGGLITKVLRNNSVKAKSVAVYSEETNHYRLLTEGMLLANYVFDKYKTKKENLIKQICLLTKRNMRLKQELDRQIAIVESVYMCRELINSNAQEVNPTFMAKFAQNQFKGEKNVKITVLGRAELKKRKYNGILAVGQGSEHEQRIVVIEYTGGKKGEKPVALVGKGVCYDAGGLNIKPTGYMEEMKSDMSGAAAVYSILDVAVKLRLPINIIGAVGLVENSVDGKSYFPGDVIIMGSGKSIEVGNTDAEGRVVLGDVLYHIEKTYKPTHIVDFATLTGATIVCFGEKCASIMGNDQQLIDDLRQSGYNVHERLWQLPMWEDYDKDVESDIADVKNIGLPKGNAGTISGGKFLENFITKGKTKWAHIDIGGTAFLNKEGYYINKGATGFGVRLAVDWLRSL